MGIQRILHPAWYQGERTSTPYFEGWYFKMATSSSGNRVVAVIPGVSKGDEPHAFIQVISSNPSTSWYVRFPIEEFFYEPRELRLAIGGNRFSLEGIELTLDSGDLHLHGSIKHHDVQPFPVSLTSPGIMGWYAYMPFMECFHGVVSMHHRLSGILLLNGCELDFQGGEGYIEKDWGRSFPSAWIWMQSNSFPSGESTCMLSVARIPFLGRSFTGFLGFVSIGGELTRFATYTGARITLLEQSIDECRIVITTRKESIEFIARSTDASRLTAPRHGSMNRLISESVSGTITLKVTEADGTVRFNERGTMAGIELSEADNLIL